MNLKQDGKLAFLRLARHFIGFLILVYTLLHYCMLMPLTSEFLFYREQTEKDLEEPTGQPIKMCKEKRVTNEIWCRCK